MKVNWIELRALHQLRTTGEALVNGTLSDSSVIRYLIDSLGVLDKTAKKIHALDGFESVYNKNYGIDYERYSLFLEENNLLRPQTRFEFD
ncbi:MAG: hypothetical protein EOO89_00305, partial [Pedobacter sp.]